jgi:tripartite ATP-independent transporter DctM subunit
MTPQMIGIWILFGSFLLLILMRVPIAFSVGLSTILTFLYLDIPLNMITTNIVKGLNSFSLMAIPFFIFAGEVMGAGGISDRVVGLAKALVGQFRGGLAQVNCLDSMFFGGISGSPVADVSSLGSIMIPIMKKNGYDMDFSAGITMASSIQGLLIPPSHNMIIYAMAAGSVSIAKLFMAGVVPGVLLGISLMIYSYFVSVKRNYPKEESFSLKKLFIALKESIFGLMTIVIIMVGVLTGIFTATESAAIASVWAVIVTFFIYREVPFKEMWNILTKTLKTLAIIMILIGISTAFGWLIAYLKVPSMIISSIMGLTSNPIFILLLINTILLFLGMIMDMSSIIVIATPILLPIATSIGIDPVHFGVIMILNLGIGLITPPVGGVLYVCSGITGMKIEALTKAMFSFYVVMLIVLILVTYVPAVSMTLPNMMFK